MKPQSTSSTTDGLQSWAHKPGTFGEDISCSKGCREVGEVEVVAKGEAGGVVGRRTRQVAVAARRARPTPTLPV